MLKIKLIEDQATLNNFDYLEVKEYIPGIALTIKFQISESETKLRHIPGTSATMEVTFQNREGEELSVTATMLFNPDDRSLWSVALTAEQTEEIIGSNFMVELTDGATIKSGMAYGVLSKITFDGEC